jgi:hypothetical protein
MQAAFCDVAVAGSSVKKAAPFQKRYNRNAIEGND